MRKTPKQERWDKLRTVIVPKITDRLGRPVDEGIFETIVALQANGINTTASCEGHLHRGIAAPWVDIKAKGIAREEKQVTERLMLVHQKIDEGKLSPKELAAAMDQMEEEKRPIKILNLQECQKLIHLLTLFYENRYVRYDVRLILEFYGFGDCRMVNQGWQIQDISELGERKRKLSEYQKEMAAFTLFLKQQYFG